MAPLSGTLEKLTIRDNDFRARSQFPNNSAEISRFDWLRRKRNEVEYPDLDTPYVDSHDVEEVMQYATEIFSVVTQHLKQLK